MKFGLLRPSGAQVTTAGLSPGKNEGDNLCSSDPGEGFQGCKWSRRSRRANKQSRGGHSTYTLLSPRTTKSCHHTYNDGFPRVYACIPRNSAVGAGLGRWLSIDNLTPPRRNPCRDFFQRVYSRCKGYCQSFMLRRIAAIYRRLYTLISVCVTWRRIGLGCPNLWLVVPIINPQIPRDPSSELIRQRAGSGNLHLAILVDNPLLKKLENLAGHWHRFSVINLWSDSTTGGRILQVLEKILEHSPPGSISRLSLRDRDLDFAPHLSVDSNPNLPIAELADSLSVFRTSGISTRWEHITFSHRLVQLRIDQIVANNNSELRGFFTALSSASELKELKLIEMIFDPGVLDRTVPLEVVSLPKLEFLYVERGHFNVLDFILSHIARGTYHITLNLDRDTAYRYPYFEEQADFEAFYRFLRSVPVDKLILSGCGESPWSIGSSLQHTLESVPGLKTLVLNHYFLDSELFAGLRRPTPSETSMDRGTFPRLTRLEFQAGLTTSLSELKPDFKAIFESHCIQTMAPGGEFMSQRMDGKHLALLKWMKGHVSHLKRTRSPIWAPESRDAWQLWDI
ncbi:unnamed protein product [Rhizoctonia solani]|uniref:Uncharacterized protein n=1 Tax=Rhizoctonia solani TaxID=456999 RepID=A0A8H3GV59_9AGAM|nr:unnamed protein product [Rhizoctonia solani]